MAHVHGLEDSGDGLYYAVRRKAGPKRPLCACDDEGGSRYAMRYETRPRKARRQRRVRLRFQYMLLHSYEMLETLLPEDDYKYSAVSPQRCAWDGSCETCPNAFLCNFR